MTALKQKLDSNETTCERLPQEIISIANKIRNCSTSPTSNEDMSKALKEMIEVCQNRLVDLHSFRDEYAVKLQKRRNALAERLMRRKRS